MTITETVMVIIGIVWLVAATKFTYHFWKGN